MLNDIVTVFLSIVIEASPFIALGVLVSTFIHLYIDTENVFRFFPRNQLLQCFCFSLTGVFFPVCECGNVPVAKKLVEKNVSPASAISFLLGAPVLNPVVILATMIAFPDSPEILLGRMFLSLFIATFVGYVFSFASKDEILINTKSDIKCSHSHHKKQGVFIDHFVSEFTMMSGIMIIGALIASLSQNIIPRELLLSMSENSYISILAMMLLAFIISICSTTDSFFALAYSHQFSSSALLAFLVFGPMIDMKSLLLMKTTFTNKALFYLCLLVFSIVLFTALFLDNYIFY